MFALIWERTRERQVIGTERWSDAYRLRTRDHATGFLFSLSGIPLAFALPTAIRLAKALA